MIRTRPVISTGVQSTKGDYMTFAKADRDIASNLASFLREV